MVYKKGMDRKELKEWREKHGYTRKALAEVLGVKVPTIYRWEKGLRKISPFLHLALEALHNRQKRGEAK
jgi:DNA-binding XRE family transcriptional regulator